MKLTTSLTLSALLGLVALSAPAQDAKSPAKAEKPKSQPYNEKADAKADIQAALAKAKKENRRVLIQWGGNWCSWCILLSDRLKSDVALRRKLLYEYDVVHVDIGKGDKHLDLVKEYGATLSDGVPYLTILDSAGKPVINQRTDGFETKADGKNGHDPKQLLEFLTKHEARPLVAEAVLAAALKEAEATDRRVFVHFGAPWCGWCHKLEDWMAKPEIAKTLGKDLVDCKIDIDRMEGGKAILERYNTKAAGGIPWFVFADAKGKALASSDGPKGNIGHPYEEHEVAHFMEMLKTTKRHLADADLDLIQTSLLAQKPKK